MAEDLFVFDRSEESEFIEGWFTHYFTTAQGQPNLPAGIAVVEQKPNFGFNLPGREGEPIGVWASLVGTLETEQLSRRNGTSELHERPYGYRVDVAYQSGFGPDDDRWSISAEVEAVWFLDDESRVAYVVSNVNGALDGFATLADWVDQHLMKDPPSEVDN